jgi:hypothetical protein
VHRRFVTGDRFEEKAPFKISRLAIDVEARER